MAEINIILKIKPKSTPKRLNFKIIFLYIVKSTKNNPSIRIKVDLSAYIMAIAPKAGFSEVCKAHHHTPTTHSPPCSHHSTQHKSGTPSYVPEFWKHIKRVPHHIITFLFISTATSHNPSLHHTGYHYLRCRHTQLQYQVSRHVHGYPVPLVCSTWQLCT